MGWQQQEEEAAATKQQEAFSPNSSTYSQSQFNSLQLQHAFRPSLFVEQPNTLPPQRSAVLSQWQQQMQMQMQMQMQQQHSPVALSASLPAFSLGFTPHSSPIKYRQGLPNSPNFGLSGGRPMTR